MSRGPSRKLNYTAVRLEPTTSTSEGGALPIELPVFQQTLKILAIKLPQRNSQLPSVLSRFAGFYRYSQLASLVLQQETAVIRLVY